MQHRGFTLVEVLVVMAIVATLLALVMPRFAGGVDRARETVLRHDLKVMREALDHYHADHGRWPATLAELVDKRYLRALPVDPLTDSAQTWQTVPAAGGGVHDELADGQAYSSW
jgi:general secretion pathway protein G